MAQRAIDELVPVPRSTVRFPLEMKRPPGFVADRPDTWPLVDGQLEFVGGGLCPAVSELFEQVLTSSR